MQHFNGGCSMELGVKQFIDKLKDDDPMKKYFATIIEKRGDVSLDRLIAEQLAYEMHYPLSAIGSDDLAYISDNVDRKEIARALVKLGPPYDASELKFIIENCGAEFEHDINDMDNWSDDIVDKYAKHIKNYYYNYKPEATAIDPSIDPNEQQIGPMAQDIEKVNPAAVIENDDGVKMVDANRLALMNAGTIAELARDVENIKIILKELIDGLQLQSTR